ncbi:heat shock protein 22 [Drosophila subpulchrella]|uniref:heat shock protein 22 n=1 Tax=Drosophila subpulchrella TaxID=1486046 RepID=UPI0018A18863|nr:heat shock protein 22 [Drosophila subpulchrella]
MRSLPMFWRMAEEMTRMPRLSSPFQAFFHEPPVWSVALPRNWQQIARWQEQEFAPPATINKEGYKLTLDVKDYSELKVKVLDESVVLVEGKSEQQKGDQGGYSSRHFLRRFVLPEGYEADKVTSSLSSDGVLTISVPNPPAVQESLKEREVPIEQTGEPAKKSADEPKIENKQQ